MDFILPTTTYSAPRDGRQVNPVIASKPQRKYSGFMPPSHMPLPSSAPADIPEFDDDMPTPRANQQCNTGVISINQSMSSPGYPEEWRLSFGSSISADTEFEEYDDNDDDDIYDAPSDNDSEIVPFKVSDSIRRHIKPSGKSGKKESRLSVVIPSPALWPTIQKLQKQSAAKAQLPLSPRTPLSPDALARLAASTRSADQPHHLAPSTAPSLSDGVSSLSCPSTPDLRCRDEDDARAAWDVPLQLHPDALDTLKQISLDFEAEADITAFDHLLVPSAEQEPPPPMAERGLSLSITIPKPTAVVAEEDELSALSVPSPGGFFASLDQSSSDVWKFPKPEEEDQKEPSTSVAAKFYGVPWMNETDDDIYDGPPTARRIPQESQQVVDFDVDYEQKLHKSATANMSRTSLWLATQESYLAAFNGEEFKSPELGFKSPQTPASASSLGSKTVDTESIKSSPKKGVRFAEEQITSPASTLASPQSASSDSLFYRAFQHSCTSRSGKDAYTNREARAEALRAQRYYLPDTHRARLTNTYALVAPKIDKKDSAPWKTSHTDEEAEKNRDLLANVSKEQQALQQISLSKHYLDAERFLNQGSLLPHQAAEFIRCAPRSPATSPRILDLGGEPTASWGWAVALEYREAKVYTAVPATQSQTVNWTAHRGPSNHRTVAVPNTWTLPFPAASFDVVSARSLHSILRNSRPTRDGGDEYDATMAEINRVLRPGGYMHFSVMDAEVSAPASSSIAARSIEFAVSLRTRGYDACAGRRFVSKLEKAGFRDVRRSWMSLPIGGAEPDGMAAVTGLYGSLAWEKWMLKMQLEAGRPEERLLEGIAKALDQAKNGEGASWRVLVGCASKA